METGAEREVKTEGDKDSRRGVGTKRSGTKGQIDRRMVETYNKQLIPYLMKLLFH